MKSEDVRATSPVLEVGSSKNESQAPALDSWSPLAKVLAALGAVGGLLLHLIGHIGHLSYIAEWGLDPGIFPKPLDEIMVLGYIAIMERSVSILSLLGDQIWRILGIWMVITGYVYVVWRLEKSARREKATKILERLPERFVDLSKSALGSALVLAVIPAGLYLVAVTTVIPAALGDSYGRSSAQKEYRRFVEGCTNTSGGSHCFEVMKDGKRIAHGFLIDSSTTHIALFDVDTKRARAIVREGTEVIADERPTLKQSSTLEK